MQVTARDVERIPPGNLRVPRDEFAAVWIEAERRCAEQSRTGAPDDWYAAGVAITCQWLATAIVPSILGGTRPAQAPVSNRTAAAHEELIEYEVLAAERLAARHPDWLEPGWIEAVTATLAWAWKQTAGPPIDMRHAHAG